MGSDDPPSETEQRILHTGRPLWAASRRIRVRTRGQPRHARYDVVVVGAGISGALVAEAIADGRRRVLVVDRRGPIEGSTLASTSMIQSDLDLPLHHLARSIGDDAAGRVWRRSARAVETLAELVEQLGIECGFTRAQTLYIAGSEYGSRALAEEVAARRAAGLTAELVDAERLRGVYGIDRTAAIVSPVSAPADPARLTAGLLRAAARRGVELASPVEITDVVETGDEVALATGDGRALVAGRVVFCTGYEFLGALASPSHRVVSTWALATRPGLALPQWLRHCLVWEGADPYLYLRATRDGRLIAGGEDEGNPTAHQDPAKLAAKASVIATKVERLLGIRLGAPEHAWAAPFGTTTDSLPIIDTAPGCARIHAVMGFGGNGITFSVIAAELIEACIEGRQDSDAQLFRYSR